MTNPPIYLTPQTVKARLCLRCVKTVYNYLHSGEFPKAKRKPGGWLIPESDLEEFLNRHTQK